MTVPFRRPSLVNPAPVIAQVLDEVEAITKRYSGDPHLTPAGRLARASTELAPRFRRLSALQRPLREKRQRLLATLDALDVNARAGRRPTQEQSQAWLTLVTEARRDPAVRARLFERLVDDQRLDGETQALRRFVLDLPDELVDFAHARALIELRLSPAIPGEARGIAAAIDAVDRELSHLQTALDSIAAAADRDVLEAEGAVGPRIVEWTVEERAAFAAEHGMAALAEAVARETLATHAPVRTAQAEDDPERSRAAVADLAVFFGTAVLPAEAAADAALGTSA